MTKTGDILIDALKEIEDLGANGCTAARLGNIAHAALIEHRAASRPAQSIISENRQRHCDTRAHVFKDAGFDTCRYCGEHKAHKDHELSIEIVRTAIADGYSNGNQQYEDWDKSMQTRFDDAARAVLSLTGEER